MGCSSRRRVRLHRIKVEIRRSWLIATADHALHDVVDEGEITLHFAVIEHLDRLTSQDRFSKQHWSHIRSAPWAIDRKKAQASGWHPIQVAVGVRHQLIRFLAGRIKTHGVIHGLLFVERQIAVAAIYRAAGGIDQILNAVVTTAFKDVAKTHQVALDVGSWIFQRIANTRLSCKIHHHARSLSRKQLEQGITVLQGHALESPSSSHWCGQRLDASKACLL